QIVVPPCALALTCRAVNARGGIRSASSLPMSTPGRSGGQARVNTGKAGANRSRGDSSTFAAHLVPQIFCPNKYLVRDVDRCSRAHRRIDPATCPFQLPGHADPDPVGPE